MSPTAVVLLILTAMAFPLMLWAIGRTVTAMGERAPYSGSRSRHYLAGRLYGVRITAMIDGGDELLVSLTAQPPTLPQPPVAPWMWCSASPPASAPWPGSRRWRDEGTLPRAYLSHDGALMLADPLLGGNAACEPATTVTWQAPKRTTSADQPPPDNS